MLGMVRALCRRMSPLFSIACLLLQLPPLQPCHSDAECPGQEQCVDFVCTYQGNEFPNCSTTAACNCPADTVCVDENCKDARIRCRSVDGTCRVEPDQVVCRCDEPASGAADPPMSGATYEACQTGLAVCVGEDYEGLRVEHSLPPTPAPSSPICAPGTPKQSFQSPPSCFRDSECGGAETCVSGSCALVGEGARACKSDWDCNDSNVVAYLKADETCDGADNDCDGIVAPRRLPRHVAQRGSDGFSTS